MNSRFELTVGQARRLVEHLTDLENPSALIEWLTDALSEVCDEVGATLVIAIRDNPPPEDDAP